VELIRLPAYRPELNPIERLWEDLRYRLSDALQPSLSALQEHTAKLIRAYAPDQLASLCGYDYLHRVLHAPGL
jgi:hypothetical protein